MFCIPLPYPKVLRRRTFIRDRTFINLSDFATQDVYYRQDVYLVVQSNSLDFTPYEYVDKAKSYKEATYQFESIYEKNQQYILAVETGK